MSGINGYWPTRYWPVTDYYYWPTDYWPDEVLLTELCDIITSIGPVITGIVSNATKLSIVEDDYGEGKFGISSTPLILGITTLDAKISAEVSSTPSILGITNLDVKLSAEVSGTLLISGVTTLDVKLVLIEDNYGEAEFGISSTPLILGIIILDAKIKPIEDNIGEKEFGISNQPAIDGVVFTPECIN